MKPTLESLVVETVILPENQANCNLRTKNYLRNINIAW